MGIFHIKQYKTRIDELSSINNLLEKDKEEITRQLIEVVAQKEAYRSQNEVFLEKIDKSNQVNRELKNEQIKLDETYQRIKLQQESIKFQNDKLGKENEELITKSDNLSIQLSEKDIEIQDLKLVNTKYMDIIGDNYAKIVDVKEIISGLEQKQECLEESILNQEKKEEEQLTRLKVLKEQIDRLNSEIIILQEEALLQDFGLYTPMYNFANSSLYKERLSEVRNKQKEMLKNKTAAQCSTIWTVNNSKRAGQKMTSDNIKQILRSFNNECEAIIDKVKFNNYTTIKERIKKAYQRLNILNESNSISINNEYRNLKYEELDLTYEYQVKVQEEKEKRRQFREEQRENEKLIKEIEERRREIEKEQTHYNNILLRINEQISIEKNEDRLQLLVNKRVGIERNLLDLDYALKEVDYREANQRAGYVYIISNIGAFGENVYKIGMTRRLEPLDRIDELSNASVPFKYDIHAMIFSDDAPRLESELHKAFSDKRVNMMNNRKEFFNVTLEEIEEGVKNNHDATIEFAKVALAQQYRETLQRKKIKK